MSGTPNTPEEGRSSPEIDAPAMAIRPMTLHTARKVSDELQQQFQALSRELHPQLEPDQERIEPLPEDDLRLAKLGAKTFQMQLEVIRLERKELADKRKSVAESTAKLDRDDEKLKKRYHSAGEELWKHHKKRVILEDTDPMQPWNPRSAQAAESILALYQQSDGCNKKKKRPNHWRQGALAYYEGQRPNEPGYLPGDETWCHISGMWHLNERVRAAHIVPFFLCNQSFGMILFGSRSESLDRAANALLLSERIKSWFDKYCIAVVPVDTRETPITRWRTDIISPSIKNTKYHEEHCGRDLDGKELVFRGPKRPAARFLYFHFVMACIRIKDLEQHGWQDVWARYYTQRPFPTPEPYMRQSMLFALASHYGTTDFKVVESWISDNGFSDSLALSTPEAAEAARRVHVEVEEGASSAGNPPDEDDSAIDSDSDPDSDATTYVYRPA